jgi:hypothetical protein
MAEHAVYLIPTSSSIINPHAVVIPARFPRSEAPLCSIARAYSPVLW